MANICGKYFKRLGSTAMTGAKIEAGIHVSYFSLNVVYSILGRLGAAFIRGGVYFKIKIEKMNQVSFQNNEIFLKSCGVKL